MQSDGGSLIPTNFIRNEFGCLLLECKFLLLANDAKLIAQQRIPYSHLRNELNFAEISLNHLKFIYFFPISNQSSCESERKKLCSIFFKKLLIKSNKCSNSFYPRIHLLRLQFNVQPRYDLITFSK